MKTTIVFIGLYALLYGIDLNDTTNRDNITNRISLSGDIKTSDVNTATSTLDATTPVPSNGFTCSEITLTVLDANGDPIEAIPSSQISLDCSGSGNTLIQPTQPTDPNGQTSAKLFSTTAETKTITATVMGVALSDTAIVQFCRPQAQFTKLHAPDGAPEDYLGKAVSISGNCAIVGAYGDDDNGGASGSTYVFRYDPNTHTWVQQVKLTASDGAASDCFGCSVSIDGNYAIIGADGDDDSGAASGSAYIFWYDANTRTWDQQAKLTASDGAASDYFGGEVSLCGDYAIIGAHADDDNGSSSGSAYIFKRLGEAWTEQVKLIPSDGSQGDYFGTSVSISGGYAIIGASSDDDMGDDSGSAYIFKQIGETWTEQTKLTAFDGEEGDRFAQSVAMDGQYAVIGARYDADHGEKSGSAHVFELDPGTEVWSHQAKLTASDGAAFDYFGRAVCISGDRAIVSAPRDDDNGSQSGSVYLFEREGELWNQQTKLTAPDGNDEDYFGRCVAISGDHTIIGADGDDDHGDNSGSSYCCDLTVHIADFNTDENVDLSDYSILAAQWYQLPAEPPADAAPCGGDCIIDELDLQTLAENWLQ